MPNCPNCGAEVAPTVLSCAACRMPLPPDLGQQSGTWGRPGASGGPDTTQVSGLYRDDVGPGNAGWAAAPPARSIRLDQPSQATHQQAPYQQTPYQQAPYGSPGSADHVLYTRPDGASTPPPPPSDPLPVNDDWERRKRRQTITMIVLVGVVLAVALASAGVVAVSMLQTPQAQQTGQPVPPPVPPSSAAPAPPSPTAGESTPAPPTPTPTPTPTSTPGEGPTTMAAGAKPCGGNVFVPASGTSCEFAKEVAAAVAAADPDATRFDVEAHSPVTKKDYTMACERNRTQTTCRGGNNAVVWLRS